MKEKREIPQYVLDAIINKVEQELLDTVGYNDHAFVRTSVEIDGWGFDIEATINAPFGKWVGDGYNTPREFERGYYSLSCNNVAGWYEDEYTTDYTLSQQNIAAIFDAFDNHKCTSL